MNYEGKGTMKSNDFTAGPVPGLPEFNDTFMQQGGHIPDLEKEDHMPNAGERIHLRGAAQAISIEDKIQDKLANDVHNVQNKYKAAQVHPKDILKSIIAKGEYKETVHLFGTDWTLRALDQGDMMMVFDEVKDTVTTIVGRMTALEFMKVVFSIEAISDVPIYELFEDIKITDYPNKMVYIVMVKKALQRYLEAFAPDVIDALFVKYQEIDNKRTGALAELKNS